MLLSIDVGIKNLAICILNTEKDIIYWKVLTLSQNKGEDQCHCLIRTLDVELDYELNTVLIEKQPARNNKMRIIEALLNAYFVIKQPSAKVLIYSSKHKLGSNTFRGKSGYTERKRLSIARTTEYLKKIESKWLKEFSESKKKDDYADSLLQALSYLKDPLLKEIEELNLKTVVKIVARAPTEKQKKSKNYSKSNIKYCILNNEEIPEKSLKKLYGSLDEAKKDLNIQSF